MAQQLRAAGEDAAVVIMIDPDFARVFTPWLYWRDPDALRIRIIRFFVDVAWRGWQLTRRLLGHRTLAEMALKSSEDKRRSRAIIEGIRAAFKRYRPAAYDGKIVMFCSSERAKRLSDPITGWPVIAPNVEIVKIATAHGDIFGQALPALGSAIGALLNSPLPPARTSIDRAMLAAR
jgi:thioesterase domain-containing protein